MKPGYAIKHIAGTFIFLLILFISARRLDYFPGVVYSIIAVIMVILNYTVLKIDPALLAERLL
jgi:hypothetical protein